VTYNVKATEHTGSHQSRERDRKPSSLPGYRHDPIVYLQFSECIRLPPSRLLDRLTSRWNDTAKIKEETLVMLAREYSRRGNDGLAWKLVLAICERVQPSIERSIKLWRLPPHMADELVESLVAGMYDAVLNNGEAGAFWEIKFWVCFERRLLSALRKYRQLSDRGFESETADEGPQSLLESTQERQSEWKDPAMRAVIADGLAQLPETLRTAFMLKHWAGFAEYSSDPSERFTIAHVMGVSSRTVRNYLMRAEVLLNEWREGPTDARNRVGEQDGR